VADDTMTAALTSASRALLVVVAVVLVADGVLGALTVAIAAIGGSPTPPWWIQAHLLERSRWVVFALLVAGATRLNAVRTQGDDLSRAAAVWRFVGVLAVAVPLLWIVARWIVQAALFTLADRWDVDGQVFLSADYYRQLAAGYAPWALGGAAAIVWSRHVA
jgi:hypothetical protein